MTTKPTIHDIHLCGDGSCHAYAGERSRRVIIDIDPAGSVTLHGPSGFVGLSMADIAVLPELHAAAAKARESVLDICGGHDDE